LIPVLSSSQIRAADQHTIRTEPIASIDLMERASMAFVRVLMEHFDSYHRVFIVAGTGNNGGDGLAAARLLESKGYSVSVFAVGQLDKASPDFLTNYQRIEGNVTWLSDPQHLPITHGKDIVIDALFGSGLTRPLGGLYQVIVDAINRMPGIKVALDISSGLKADALPDPTDTIFRADYTISFQTPKLVFFQPSLSEYVGQFIIADIGLDLSIFSEKDYNAQYTTKEDVAYLLHPRGRFTHKGDYGRLHLIGGSKGKIGSIALSSMAAMKSGAGLLFTTVPECGSMAIHQLVPEAMIEFGEGTDHLRQFPSVNNASVIGIGPGLGLESDTIKAFDRLLESISPRQQLVVDADGINILSESPSLFEKLPTETILTPHPGEFERLIGEWEDDLCKLEKLRELCQKYKIHIVLKGAYSAVCDSAGRIYFNATGNPGMATAGSGDVLLGVISGLLSSGISPIGALKLGVYVHGLAGDLAARELGERSLMASDIVRFLPEAYVQIDKSRKIK
jgi:hydroxyethylthiazole kinase-like uncharacterized protein yjeF